MEREIKFRGKRKDSGQMKNFDWRDLICGALITALGCLGLWLILARGW